MNPQAEPTSRSSQLRRFLERSRVLSPTDLNTVIALADEPGVRFVRLEPKGAVVDDVLTGIIGVLHVRTEVALKVLEALLFLKETALTVTVTPLGVGAPEEFEVIFATADL